MSEITSGVVSNLMRSSNTIVSVLSIGAKVVETEYHFQRIMELAEEFCDNVAHRVEIAEQSLRFVPGIVTDKGVTQEPSRSYIRRGISYIGSGISYVSSGISSIAKHVIGTNQLDTMSFGKYEQIKPRIVELIHNIHKLTKNDYARQRQAFAKEYSDALSGTLNGRITNKLAMPVASGIASSFSDVISCKGVIVRSAIGTTLQSTVIASEARQSRAARVMCTQIATVVL